jgi:hypothetical protein
VSRIVFVLVACLLALTLLVSAAGCGYSHHNKGGKTNTTDGY